MAFTVYPYLWYAEKGERIDPTPMLVSTWYDAVNEVVGHTRFVVTETGHPASGRFGTEDDQTQFVQNLLAYLGTTNAETDFISWWSIEDSETHPDEEFRDLGLLQMKVGNDLPTACRPRLQSRSEVDPTY